LATVSVASDFLHGFLLRGLSFFCGPSGGSGFGGLGKKIASFPLGDSSFFRTLSDSGGRKEENFLVVFGFLFSQPNGGFCLFLTF